MMAPYSVPFIADEKSLPAPLLTLDAIEFAVEIPGDTTGRQVDGVGIHFVVKHCNCVSSVGSEAVINDCIAIYCRVVMFVYRSSQL